MENENQLCHQLPPVMSSAEFRKRLKAFYRKKPLDKQLREKSQPACLICKGEKTFDITGPFECGFATSTSTNCSFFQRKCWRKEILYTAC